MRRGAASIFFKRAKMAAAEVAEASVVASQQRNDAFTASFPEFVLQQDLGLFMWNPGPDSNSQLKSFGDVTTEEILSRLHIRNEKHTTLEAKLKKMSLNSSPPKIDYSYVRFPVRITSLPSQEFPNRFPNDPGYIVPLFAAIKSGLGLPEIDFVLGGSALEVLANRRIDGEDTKYLVQRVHNVIFLVKSKSYILNYADVGFQFERLVTGGKMEDKHAVEKHEHLQLMKLGDSKVLLSADVDAVDDDGGCVEIKSGNPRYFGTKVMFQMISSGAQTLIQADKRGPSITGVKKRTIKELCCEHPKNELQRMQVNILRALTELKSQISEVSDETPSELAFSGSGIKLIPLRERTSILPAKQVTEELLSAAKAK